MRLVSLAVLFLSTAPVFAQDMPLFTFTKPGEGWKPVGFLPVSPAFKPQFEFPNDLGKATATTFSPDGTTMFAASATGKHVWAFVVKKTGTYTDGEPYCPLRLRFGQEKLAVTDLTVDTAGRIYAATLDGIQVFDPTGRLSGVLLLPTKGTPVRIGWTGEKRDHLAVQIDDKVFARPMNATGQK